MESRGLTFEWRSMIFYFDDSVAVEFTGHRGGEAITTFDVCAAVCSANVYTSITRFVSRKILRRRKRHCRRRIYLFDNQRRNRATLRREFSADWQRNGGNGWWQRKEISQKCNSNLLQIMHRKAIHAKFQAFELKIERPRLKRTLHLLSMKHIEVYQFPIDPRALCRAFARK